MDHHHILESLEKIAVLVAVTYFASRTRVFERVVWRVPTSRDRAFTGAFFCVLAVVEVALTSQVSPLDSRVISATAAGLFGGPIIGALAGVVTGLASGILIRPEDGLAVVPAAIGGILAGWISIFRSEFRLKILGGFLVGTICHGLWLATRFWSVSVLGPWDAFVVEYGFPMLVTGAGVSLFLVIIGDMRSQRERIERGELARALELAQDVLPRMGPGLDRASAERISEAIQRLTSLPAVALVSASEVLAHVGVGTDHHSSGGAIPGIADRALDGKGIVYSAEAVEVCPEAGCRLTSAAAAPLIYDGTVVGGVVMYEIDNVRVSPDVAQLGVQLARFMTSFQIQVAALAGKEHAVAQAELKALQAQVHPHFLFNALTTIAGLCDVDPRQASVLTVKLGDVFRASLRSQKSFVCALEDELALVRSYLEIEMARLGDRLTVIEDIDESALDRRLPSYSLQPLVENAVLHGVSKKSGDVSLRLIARLKGDRLVCWVVDTGHGFDARTINWLPAEPHALPMLMGRLRSMYGKRFGLRIRSRPGKGTLACLWVPVTERTDPA